MHVVVMGLSHKTAPIEIREKQFFPEKELGEALEVLLEHRCVNEGVILSTCNRTEIYGVCNDIGEARKHLANFLSKYSGIRPRSLQKYLYFYDSAAAIRHLYRVAASLDSMVVGEAQILGQVKEAYFAALESQATNIIFNKLFRESFTVGKRARTETDIGESAVSISYAAVQLAKKVFEDLKGHTVMIIGAGEMGELTVQHLVSQGVTTVLVTNRTHKRAMELAKRFQGKAVKFDEYFEYMKETDIIISSTGAPHYIVKKNDMHHVMRKRRNKPIFLIDIAVPRDIEPSVGDLYNVFLYDIDDLESVVEANKQEREKEAKKAEAIINEEVKAFTNWLSTLEVTPTIATLKERAEKVRIEETQKAMSKFRHLSDKEKNAINALTKVIVNRLLHKPVVNLKKKSNEKDGYIQIDALRDFFELEEEDKKKGKKSHLHSVDQDSKVG